MLYTQQGTLVEPGDFAVVRTHDSASRFIQIGEWLAVRAERWGQHVPKLNEDWEHAILYVGGEVDNILEAESGGAQFRAFHYAPEDVLWSSDTPSLALTYDQRRQTQSLAWKYWHTPYSWLDYDAIALHALHIPAPWLKSYIASDKHMICSQLVDQCRLDMGSHLFNDGRWPGFVMPLDLRFLITG